MAEIKLINTPFDSAFKWAMTGDPVKFHGVKPTIYLSPTDHCELRGNGYGDIKRFQLARLTVQRLIRGLLDVNACG